MRKYQSNVVPFDHLKGPCADCSRPVDGRDLAECRLKNNLVFADNTF